MPAYHQYQGSRIDVTGVTDVAMKDRLRDAVRAIREQDCGGDEWLERELRGLAAMAPAVRVDLLVHVPDWLSWTIWSLEGGKIRQTGVGFFAGEREVELDDSLVYPDCEVEVSGSDEDGEVDGFPLQWSDEAALRTAVRAVPEVSGLAFLDGNPCWFARSQLTRLEPRADDPAMTSLLESLWAGKDLELGMDGVDGLARPDAREPLTSGHVKARLAAIAAAGRRRDPRDAPELLAALAHPASREDEVRKALYQAVSWLDTPAVRQRLLAGLEGESPEVQATIRYVAWRLEGLLPES